VQDIEVVLADDGLGALRDSTPDLAVGQLRLAGSMERWPE
jgi:hypothetical protein